MRILGGKGRLAADLADVIGVLAAATGCASVEDRFCGTLAVGAACDARGLPLVAAEDGCAALVSLYRAVAAGWEPPRSLTREQYHALAAGPRHPADPLTAFVGIFCSVGGKWWAGWLPDDHRWPEGGRGRSAAAKAAHDLAELRPLLQRLELREGDGLGPVAAGRVAYFDPPYAGTTGYKGAPVYSPAEAWPRLSALASAAPCLVTEFRAPAPWVEVAALPVSSPGLTVGKIERVFAAGLSLEALSTEPSRRLLAELHAAREARRAEASARYRARKA